MKRFALLMFVRRGWVSTCDLGDALSAVAVHRVVARASVVISR
jgi:hypothetical protein